MCFELASLLLCVNVRVFKYIDGQHLHVKKCDLTPSYNSCAVNATQVFPMKHACCSLVNNDSTSTESESTLMWDICHDGKHWCSLAFCARKEDEWDKFVERRMSKWLQKRSWWTQEEMTRWAERGALESIRATTKRLNLLAIQSCFKKLINCPRAMHNSHRSF